MTENTKTIRAGRGANEVDEVNSFAPSSLPDGAAEAIRLARSYAPEAVKIVHSIACGQGGKPISAYVRSRAATALLEVAGLIKAGAPAETGDASEA